MYTRTDCINVCSDSSSSQMSLALNSPLSHTTSIFLDALKYLLSLIRFLRKLYQNRHRYALFNMYLLSYLPNWFLHGVFLSNWHRQSDQNDQIFVVSVVGPVFPLFLCGKCVILPNIRINTPKRYHPYFIKIKNSM